MPLENFANRMFRAFSIPSFRYLWINTITFSLVQGMALLTFLQLARELSESNKALGFFGFAVGIPVLIFGLPIGIIADRVDRRILITASHVVSCVASLGLALLFWTGDLNLALALILAGISGLGIAIGQPIRQTIVPSIVPRKNLLNAIALNNVGMQSGQFIGPVFAGVLVATLDFGWAFTIQAGLLIAGTFSLIPLRLPPLERTIAEREISLNKFFQDIRDGFFFVARSMDIRVLFFLLIITTLVVNGPWQTLLPRISEDQLSASKTFQGVLLSIFGAAMFIMSFIIAALGTIKNAGGWFALTLVIGGSIIVGIGFSHTTWLTIVLMILSGFNAAFFVNLNLTLIQINTPGFMMARVMSIYTIAMMGGAPFSALLAGLMADVIGSAGLWFSICGASMAMIAAIIIVTQPKLRKMSSAPRTEETVNA